MIVKMPEKTWQGIAGVTTSIFIFRTNTPHGNKDIIKYWIEEDNLKTVKNAGRQDLDNCWEDNGTDNLLKYWVNILQNKLPHKTKQISKTLEYDMPVKQSILTEDCFNKVILDRIMFENSDIKEKIEEIQNKIASIKNYEWMLWAIKNKEL